MSETPLRLTQLVAAGGCAAKMGPGDLRAVIAGLGRIADPRLLVGPETLDDAAVFKLTDELALCFTTDFITPLVDDPFTWGRIAATNAISDIYAMGGTPVMALNVVCWSNCLPTDLLGQVLAGGARAAVDAGCLVGGGHSVHAQEPKYGMAVVGTVHPQKIIRNRGANPGDRIGLTKPLGTGVICTAIKNGAATEAEERSAVESMTTLNRAAAEAAINAQARALTDVTGFGLIGHLCEMLGDEQNLAATIETQALPLLPGLVRHIEAEMIPGGTQRNRDTFVQRVAIEARVGAIARTAVFDPQTSGGLLAAIPPDMASRFETEAVRLGVAVHWIGTFQEGVGITLV